MKDACIIILVRHGESVFNRDGFVGGDSPLTAAGRQQALETKELLKNFRFDEVYSSNLKRAIETAEIIAGKNLKDNNKVAGLRERNFGSLEEKSSMYHDDEHEKRKSLTHEENWEYKHVPDMESDKELAERFTKNLIRVAKRNLGKTILVAAHGGTIRTTLMKLEGKTYQDLPQGSFRNGGYVVLEYSGDNLKVADKQ